VNLEKLEDRVYLSASSGFVPYSMQTTSTNTVQNVNVLAISFDPTIPSQNNKHFWEVIPGWKNPHSLATAYESEMEYASGGAINFNIVEWRDVNDIPVLDNGYHYTADEFYRYSQNNWSGFQQEGISADFNKVFYSQNIFTPVNSGVVDEIWLFGEHHFQLFGESWMAGPNAFFINGNVYNCPELNRPVAGLSFDCGRGLPEMMHNMAHRTESTMERIYGGWNRTNPITNWDRFAAVSSQTINGIGGVGNCHFPVNSQSDYDYGNTSVVKSTANDWANYPNMTFNTSPVSRNSWSSGVEPDYHKDYLSWWFGHLPRASDKTPDGKQANWWKYIYDYNDYDSNGLEKPFTQNAYAKNISDYGGTTFTFTASFSSAYDVLLRSIGSGNIIISGPNGYSQYATLISTSSSNNAHYLVATFSVTAPNGFWDAADNGNYLIKIVAGSVSDAAGRTVGQISIGSFNVNVQDPKLVPPVVSLSVMSGDRSAKLFWITSYSKPSQITGYKVSYSTDLRTWKTLPMTYHSNSATVTGLTNGRSYYFKVGVITTPFGTVWSPPSNRIVIKQIFVTPRPLPILF